MTHKLLSLFRAIAEDDRVGLSCYKSAPECKPEFDEHFRTFRVCRMETDFNFSKDYAEYFDGLLWQDADLIFEGSLTATNGRNYIYIDKDVKTSSTYSYWMATVDSLPVGPRSVKIRDREIWWPLEKTQSSLMALKEKYPDQVTVETIGKSVRSREIWSIRLGNAQKCIGLIGVVHAGESGLELRTPAFEQILANHKDLLTKVSIVAIPVVNPDQRQCQVEGVPWYLRAKANGVDINRNFPANWDIIEYDSGADSSDPDSSTYRGPSPASEPETQAVIKLFRENPVQVAYAYHAVASITGCCFFPTRESKEDKAYIENCKDYATTYCLAMQPDYPEDKILYCNAWNGSFPAWCYRKLNVPGLDIEMSEFEVEAHAQCRTDTTDRKMLKKYQQRHLNGIVAVMNKLAS